jgi:hypothetical protein
MRHRPTTLVRCGTSRARSSFAGTEGAATRNLILGFMILSTTVLAAPSARRCARACRWAQRHCPLVLHDRPPPFPRRCLHGYYPRCNAANDPTCIWPLTTTTWPLSTTTILTTTTTTTAVAGTSTTTTTLNVVRNPWTGALPAPDVRGSWDGSSYALDDNYTIDGCAYLKDPTAGVMGPLVIIGDSYKVDPTTSKIPGVSATLGPLTNLALPATTFTLDMASIGSGDDFPFKDTRGSVVLAGSACDTDTDCCLRTELDLFYGCSELYCPPETIGLDIDGSAGFLFIRLDCSASRDARPSCTTVLTTGVRRQE